MKTKRRKILLLCMQVLLPVVPGLWTVLFRPETAALSPPHSSDIFANLKKSFII